jgi:hypothetical protein
MIKIIEKERLIDNIFDYDIVLVPMSNNNSMQHGFKHEVAINFPSVRYEANKTAYGDMRKFGTIDTFESNHIQFCLCYMYTTPCYKQGGSDHVRYDDLRKCLYEVAERYNGYRIGMPVIGSSKYDGNGDRKRIFEIINETLSKLDVTVFDYDDYDDIHDIFVEIATVRQRLKDKEIDIKEYLRIRSEIEWRRRYGIYKPMPEGYTYIPRQRIEKIILKENTL